MKVTLGKEKSRARTGMSFHIEERRMKDAPAPTEHTFLSTGTKLVVDPQGQGRHCDENTSLIRRSSLE
jgi:hypothetical protein